MSAWSRGAISSCPCTPTGAVTTPHSRCWESCSDIINGRIATPCTGCSYCTEGCPMKIAIPQYFSIYNEDMREPLEEKGWTINFTNYEVLAQKFGKASECIACGQCGDVCPQHLTIIDYLKDIAAHYEGA